jgi:hypothetical protein
MDLSKFLPPRMEARLELVQQFTGKHRPTIERLCECGCGETFRTTIPNKTTVNKTHQKRKERARRKHDQNPD